VAGANAGLQFKVFDFRWPKPYYHTSALPCSRHAPFPAPTYAPVAPGPPPHTWSRTCRPETGIRCRWHTLAATDQYRPNCTIHGQLPVLNAVVSPTYSLAKAADFAESFYAGLAGGVQEFTLGMNEVLPRARWDAVARDRVWSFSQQSISLLETGRGIGEGEAPTTVPKLRTQLVREPSVFEQTTASRLDRRLYSESEYQEAFMKMSLTIEDDDE
jgi:hypothetical protein